MAIRHAAFDRIAVEERWLRRAALDEGELPGDVGCVHERRVDPFPSKRTGHVAGVAQQKPPAVAETLGFPPMHLEIGDPAQIAQARIGADAGVDRRAELGRCRRIVARVSWVAARENEPATVRQRREQDEACGADDDAGGLGRNGEANLDVRHHVLSAVRLANEMLPHGMARDAMSSAGAQQVARLADLGSAAHVERNAESLRTSVDRSDLERIALVIGNSNYAHAAQLPNPKNDAAAVAASLRRIGFGEVMEVYDLDRAAMSQAFKRFGDMAENADWAVVFFAGHGLEMNGVSYLIPTDAELLRDTHVSDEAISLTQVQAKVDAASKLGLVILDSCRNNPFLEHMSRSFGGTRAIGQGLANVEPEGNVLVAYSAKHGTTAQDGEGAHSPFTEALLSHIEEPGLEINFLFRKVRDDVRTKTQRQQEPFLYGSLSAELLYFKAAPAQ